MTPFSVRSGSIRLGRLAVWPRCSCAMVVGAGGLPRHGPNEACFRDSFLPRESGSQRAPRCRPLQALRVQGHKTGIGACLQCVR